jgi:hypothetical protein
MNEIRVMRLIREMRCDPVARWFESLLGLSGSAGARPIPPPLPRPVAVMESEDGESLLLAGSIEK